MADVKKNNVKITTLCATFINTRFFLELEKQIVTVYCRGLGIIVQEYLRKNSKFFGQIFIIFFLIFEFFFFFFWGFLKKKKIRARARAHYEKKIYIIIIFDTMKKYIYIIIIFGTMKKIYIPLLYLAL